MPPGQKRGRKGREGRKAGKEKERKTDGKCEGR